MCRISYRFTPYWVFVIFVCSISFAFADVKLPGVFGDNMVIQSGVKIPVWGWAESGEKVVVTLGKRKAETTADSSGNWKVELKAIKAGGPYEMTVTGKNTIQLKNILGGEVWVASGQSNMEWPVKLSANPDQEIASATDTKIRLFTVKKKVANQPQINCDGQWVECSPETIKDFSAVAYFFGRELRKTRKVPVGLINTSWGGTPAESWTTMETLKADPDFKPILDRHEANVAGYPAAKANYDKAFAKWKEDAVKAKAEGKTEPKAPGAPQDPATSPWQPASLYNGMIAPIVPFAIRGAIWYQGESNAGRAYQYRKLFPAMISDWRRVWGQGDFPFFFVQLANFTDRKPEPAESDWAELREAQTMTLSLPNTGMAVIIDIGEAKDIHPKNKQDVGKRLAQSAQKIAYGKWFGEYSGPMYKGLKIKGSQATITFSHSKGLKAGAKGGEELKGFAVAGEDKKFYWATAKIKGRSVIVSSDKVPHPVAVRYGWANNPEVNLYNKAGLPASPFRTDDWDGVTKAQK